MPSWVPVAVQIMIPAVSGVVVSLLALWRAQHQHELKMQAEFGRIREHYVKESRLNDIVLAIQKEIRFIRAILVPVAQRLSIPTAVDQDG